MPRLQVEILDKFFPIHDNISTKEAPGVGTYREYKGGNWTLLNRYWQGATYHMERGYEVWD